MSYPKMEKLAVGQMNVYLEVSVLHAETCEPGSLWEGRNNRCQYYHMELLITVFST